MISEQEFIDELTADLEADDPVKAMVVARSLAGQSERLQRTILTMLAAWDGDITTPVLGEMLDLPIGSLAISRTEIARVAAQKVINSPLTMISLSEDAQIQVATIIGEDRNEAGLKPLRSLLISHPRSANLRFTVYEALSKLPLKAGGYILAAGLEDRDASVRIAAARAIEHNLSDHLLDGVTNMLTGYPPVPEQIVSSVAQAGAMKLIEGLLRNDHFARLFSDYLEREPDLELLRRVRPLLESTGRRNLVSLVDRFLLTEAQAEGPLIYAVDDSNTVLRMYKAALGSAKCRLKTFENPFEAIEWADREAPDLVFTDLNMPEIDGVELASTLRSNGSLPDFPIIMVTTQSQGEDIEHAFHSGVDDFIQKPFKAAALIDAINEYTDYDL